MLSDEERLRIFGQAMAYYFPGEEYVKAPLNGWNNQGYALTFEGRDAPEYVAKFYSQDSGGISGAARLNREVSAIRYLRQEGVEAVPRLSHIRSYDGIFALFSFEQGRQKKSAELSAGDLELQVDFLVQLHSLQEQHTRPGLGTAPPNIGQGYRRILGRFGTVENTLKDTHPDSLADPLAIQGAFNRIAGHVAAVAEEARWQRFEKQERTVCHGDFGTHNTIFQAGTDGPRLKVFDWEYCGWGDPIYDFAYFITHNQMSGISEEMAERATNRYASKVPLLSETLDRLPGALRVAELEWALITLNSILPPKLLPRQRLHPYFATEAYINEQVALIERRLAVLGRVGLA